MPIDVDHLYRQYGTLVRRRCARILRDDDAARDVTQEVFLAVWRARERLVDDHAVSLLLRVATNLSLNRLRGERRRPVSDDALSPDLAADQPPTGACTIARQLLEKLFADETGPSAAIAYLRLVDGRSHDEVAREVGLSVSGVRRRLRTLRDRLEALDGVDAPALSEAA